MTTVPNTLCKKVRDISICSDCVSYRHCEVVHQWILRGTAQYNAELTKQTNEAVWKDWGEIGENVYRTEQQPCEDCIRRESVIEWLKDKDIIKTKNQEENARRELDELPSVTPQPKRGHWMVIRKEYEFMGGVVNEAQGCKCSNCDGIVKLKSDFCPSCGADMREVKADDKCGEV